MPQEAVTHVPAPPESSVHRLPRAPIVDRIEFVLDRARGKRVIHLGFVDETRLEERVEHGSWLHAQLARVAGELVGIDVSGNGVAAATALGFEAHHADCEDADVIAGLGVEPGDLVLAGELIEHLTAPGRMLEAVKPLLRPGGELVVTTPNAHALTNVAAAFLGRELVNADHVGWQSWRTCAALLERHGYAARDVAYYPFPRLDLPPGLRGTHARRARAFNAYLRLVTPLYRLRPSLADGLIVTATLARAGR